MAFKYITIRKGGKYPASVHRTKKAAERELKVLRKQGFKNFRIMKLSPKIKVH